MGLIAAKIFALVLKPPAVNVALAVLAFLVRRRAPRFAGTLAAISLLGLWVFSTPFVAGALARDIERFAALDPSSEAARSAGAIVVLGGGRYDGRREYGGDTVSPAALVRLRYAAALHRRTGLPVLVTGGTVFGEARSEAVLMAEVLEAEFGVPVRWRESAAHNTAENARFTARMLLDDGVDRAILVTEATHMLRSVEQFAPTGLTVVPAPTAFNASPPGAEPRGPAIVGWIPSARALAVTTAVLHEQLGRLWYRLRY